MWFGIPKCSPTPMLGFQDSYSECMQFLVKIIVPFYYMKDFFVYCFMTGISGEGAHFASTMPLIPCPSRRKGVTNIHWRWLVNSLNSVKYQNASLYYVYASVSLRQTSSVWRYAVLILWGETTGWSSEWATAAQNAFHEIWTCGFDPYRCYRVNSIGTWRATSATWR